MHVDRTACHLEAPCRRNWSIENIVALRDGLVEECNLYSAMDCGRYETESVPFLRGEERKPGDICETYRKAHCIT